VAVQDYHGFAPIYLKVTDNTVFNDVNQSWIKMIFKKDSPLKNFHFNDVFQMIDKPMPSQGTLINGQS